MSTLATPPGLYFTVVPRWKPHRCARMWLAFWAVRAGPVGLPIREGWRGYLRVLVASGKMPVPRMPSAATSRTAMWYVVRLCGAGSKPASALWKVGEVDNFGQWTAASPAAFQCAQYRIKATSPGEWANGTRVTIRYRLRGVSGAPKSI